MVLILLACAPATPDEKTDTGGNDSKADDGDGYSVADGDCNDDEPAVHPGATELCNGIDDDCDEAVDEDVTNTYYADADRDGSGDPNAARDACEAATGEVSNAVDCDDADGEVHPGTVELCDRIDNNCDGRVDENLTDLVYADADEDGFGDPATAASVCEPPANTVDNAEDCNDADPAVFPGQEEICNTVDDDCDGETDESAAADAATWYADADGDGFGDFDTTTRACSRPDGHVADATDCDDAVAETFPGATELCNDVDDDCDDTIDEDDAADAVTWYRDADGDAHGDPDATVAACDAPAGYVEAGDDCDDTDGNINPDITELCDGLDDNCDGRADDGATDCPCRVDWNGTSAYQFCTDLDTWTAAQSVCSAVGYNLVTVDDVAEEAWLLSTIAADYAGIDDAWWWIGYTDGATEGTFVWVGGGTSTYTNWTSGEPNNLDNEDCVTLAYDPSWNDWSCDKTTTWICEAD